jgi:hypothetical protein
MNKASEHGLLFKQPSAWIPLAMSLAALGMVLGYAAVFGIAHNEDEGTPARVFQLIMLAEIPIAAYFAIKWLPRRPTPALVVLALQGVAWLITLVTVIWLESL